MKVQSKVIYLNYASEKRNKLVSVVVERVFEMLKSLKSTESHWTLIVCVCVCV